MTLPLYIAVASASSLTNCANFALLSCKVSDGVTIAVSVQVDAGVGRIDVDLRDNPDCLPNGMNVSEANAWLHDWHLLVTW
jgi:N-methylhydantoinase B